jgi:pyruvate ferredoxin oxidoreductase delta subunit
VAKIIDKIKWQELEPGAVILEKGSSSEYHTGSWRDKKPNVNQKECIKCGICWIFCPDTSIVRTADGYFIANITYCKGCGICAHECPVGCIKMEDE